MKANPGGQLAPEEIVGRDSFIASLWETLERQSVVLVAERRAGKTSILEKMKAEPRSDTLVVLSNVQAISSSLEFVEKLMRDAYEHLSKTRKVKKRLERLWTSAGGTEIAGIVKLPKSAAPNWKLLLERTLDDLARHQGSRVIVAWDELPWGLQKIAKSEGEAVVVDLLDVLRAERHKHKSLRMVFTGSLGLHHVVGGLSDAGYASPATNDMRTEVLPPLASADARALALDLLRGEGMTSGELEATAEEIAHRVGNVPFYIHGVVSSLRRTGRPPTPEAAARAVERELTSLEDPWDMDHFRDRLHDYYGRRARLVRTILDLLAEQSPQSLGELRERLRVVIRPDEEKARRIVEGEPRELRALLKLMQRDHYLRKEGRSYAFLHDLLRRWWRLELELE